MGLLCWAGACAQPGPTPTAWPSVGPISKNPTQEAHKGGVVQSAKLVQTSPDSRAPLDEIVVLFDRPLDPLTLSAQRFSVVGADRRVMVIEDVRLHDGGSDHRRVVLRGRFGETPQTRAHSLALLGGVFGADGVEIQSSQTIPIRPPLTKHR